MTDPRPQSPIFIKTYDFLLWLIPLTLKFPRNQRFLLAERLSKLALDFYDLILDAVLEPECQAERLLAADKLLAKIRLYIRLSYDLQCINQGQFENTARRVEEIGRIMGGWQKSIKEAKTSPRR
jgi:hypothetical protein